MDYMKFPDNKYRSGSALILVVVLTALLATIGAIFVLSSRVESMSTSGIEESKALKSAVDVIIAKISNTLTNDVPGVSGQEYYDYPGEKDTWLASIEPYKDGTDYIWTQITDLTGVLQNQGDPNMKFATRNVKVDPPGTRKVILEYPVIELDSDSNWLEKGKDDDGDGTTGQKYRGQLADADGDGIADSKWIKLTDVSTGKGKEVYAAIRIIDNGGMINVNTANGFYPTSVIKEQVDGSTQSDIDLAELAYYTVPNKVDTIDELNRERNNGVNVNVYTDNYKDDVLRRIESPDSVNYQLFDMSEELDLRNRFCVDPDYDGRLRTIWENTLTLRDETFNSSTDSNLSDWEDEVCRDITGFDRNKFDSKKCDRRHLLTCWSMDRILNPDGIESGGEFDDCRMFGVNGKLAIDKNYYTDLTHRQELYKAINKALASKKMISTSQEISVKAAQIMVNLIDYVDEDLKMTAVDIQELDLDPNAPQQRVYGFEGPCVYISEIAVMRESTVPVPPALPVYSYAIELYNPYASANDAIQAGVDGDKWYLQMVTSGGTTNIPIDPLSWPSTEKFYVMYKENSDALISSKIATGVSSGSYSISFSDGDMISLMREIDDGKGGTIPKVVDSITISKNLFNIASTSDQAYSVERDISSHKCIKELWSTTPQLNGSLGIINIYEDPNVNITAVQAHPANKELDCIGDIGNIFSEEVYQSKYNTEEYDHKINLANPIYQNLFQYLTVFDPCNDNIDNDGDGLIDEAFVDGPEWKIPGRININTAPWFVLAQLPWVSKESSGTINYELSKAIVAYRDKIKIDNVNYSGTQGRYNKVHTLLYGATGTTNINEDPGFRSIGELNFVVDNSGGDLYSMWQYGIDGADLDGYPDLTKIGASGDGATDDFEERDIIFARISNLVTVRSDVFTAYILVRVGVDGPQQRAIAVLDRSDVYPKKGGGSTGKVKIKAFQMMTDIR